MSATTIQGLRMLCTNCESAETDKFVGDQRLYARNLDVQESDAARRGILATSQMASKDLMVVYTAATDGAEFKWHEVMPGVVQSRSSGGLGKADCGFDDQSAKFKNLIKRQQTERMYIHRKECMLKYIGSTYQGNQGGVSYIGNSDNHFTIASNTDLIVDMMVNDMRSFARAIDGNTALGNYTGDNQSGIVNNGLSTYPIFDGVIKQVLQNANGSYYATVDVTLPTVGAGAYWVKWYGTWIGTGTTITSVVDFINSAVNETGAALFSATALTATVVRITANGETEQAYGYGGLEVFYSADGTIDSCDAPLDGVIVENPMPYSEQPLLFDYTAPITNFYDYFTDVIKAWKKHIIQLSESGEDLFNNRTPYIACDPLLLVDKEFSKLAEVCSCDNVDSKYSFLDDLFPRFEGLKVLEGTGLWFMTFKENIVFLTNIDGTQPQMMSWYDKDCDTVKGRMEMVGNVLVMDNAAFATNASNSPFENILRAAYIPENLPHLAPECRTDAIEGYSQFQSRAAAKVTIAVNGADWDIRLQDTSFLAEGRTISTYNWTFYISTGSGAVQPATQVADVTTLFTTVQRDAIVNVTSIITLDNGATETVVIPYAEFVFI